MKKVEIFEGFVNGVKFTSKEAMDNYVANLGDPINEYKYQTIIKYVDDSEPEVVNNAVKPELPAPPTPYNDAVKYIIPTCDEIEYAADQVLVDNEVSKRVHNNLKKRMEFHNDYIESIRLVGKYCDKDINQTKKDICDAAHDSLSMCCDRLNDYKIQSKEITEDIAELNKTLSDLTKLANYYDDLAGYLSVFAGE